MSTGGDASRRRCVLVVDDEPDIRAGVQSLLQMALRNTSVLTAEDGPNGLEVLRHELVDLIVSDYKMPGMNGVEFLAEAKLVAPNARRILITAFERELADELGPRAGVEVVITKPLEPRPLIQACQRILGQGQGPGQGQGAGTI